MTDATPAEADAPGMRLILVTFVSRDGVVQAPGGPDEDRRGGFDLGGWVVPFIDDAVLEAMTTWTTQADAFLFGRRTYEVHAGSWGTVTDPGDPVATAFHTRPKYVVSRTLTAVPWSGSQLITGDVPEAVAALKRRQGGELQVHGSGELARTLLRSELVDELRLVTIPVVLGRGSRLWADDAPPMSLELVEQKVTERGVGIEALRKAGTPRTGRYSVGDEALEEGAV